MLLRLVGLVVALALVLMVAAIGARAQYGDVRLDNVATSVAGHPVSVYCYHDASEWVGVEYAHALPTEADGFTLVGRENIIYLAPRICDTLEAMLAPAIHDAVGPYMAGLALKVLLHESTHQYGVLDEGAADCNALALLRQYAVSSFGYTETVTVKVPRARTIKVKVGKVTKKVRTTVLVSAVVPNPALDALSQWALTWHHALPANYQGGC